MCVSALQQFLEVKCPPVLRRAAPSAFQPGVALHPAKSPQTRPRAYPIAECAPPTSAPCSQSPYHAAAYSSCTSAFPASQRPRRARVFVRHPPPTATNRARSAPASLHPNLWCWHVGAAPRLLLALAMETRPANKSRDVEARPETTVLRQLFAPRPKCSG